MEFDPYSEWLGISSPQRPLDHYALLGLTADRADRDDVEQAFAAAVTRVRIYQVGARSNVALAVLDELSTAYRVLIQAAQRRGNDRPRPAIDPWQRVADRVKVYAASGEPACLEEAERLATELSPADGRLHVARCALEQGCVEPQFLKTLDEFAERNGKLACHHCFTLFQRAAEPESVAVSLTVDALQSAYFNVRVSKHLLLLRARVEGMGRPWPGAQPTPCIDRRLVTWLAVAGQLLIALPLLWMNRTFTWEFAIVFVLTACGIGAISAWVFSVYRPELSCAADVAWNLVVPALLRQPPSPAACGFLVGLAKASPGQGNRLARLPVLKLALQQASAWLHHGDTTLELLIQLQRTVLHDCLRRNDTRHALVAELQMLLSNCLQGEYPLSVFERTTGGGRLLNVLTVGELAILVQRFVLLCRQRRLSVADVFQLAKHSTAINRLFSQARGHNRHSVAQLFALSDGRLTNRLRHAPSIAFELAALERWGLFEQWPDLVLHSNHRDLLLCAQGVHFEGEYYKRKPDVRTIGSGELRWLVVDSRRFEENQANLESVSRLIEFCDFCFGPLAESTTRQLELPQSAGLYESLVAESVACTRCGSLTSLR